MVWRKRAGEWSFYRRTRAAGVTASDMVGMVLQWGYGAGVDGILFFMSGRSSWASWRDKWWSVAVGRRARLRGCSRRTVASPAAAGRACGSGGVRGAQRVAGSREGAEGGPGEVRNGGARRGTVGDDLHACSVSMPFMASLGGAGAIWSRRGSCAFGRGSAPLGSVW